MAEKKTYTVHRSMHGDGRDYVRGDTREMTPADAASLVRDGALSLEGEDPADRKPAVQHTFGRRESTHNDAGYTSASEPSVTLAKQPAAKPAAKSTTKTA